MSKIEEAERLWTRESILQAENAVLQQVLSARSSEAAEASVSYARFLRLAGGLALGREHGAGRAPGDAHPEQFLRQHPRSGRLHPSGPPRPRRLPQGRVPPPLRLRGLTEIRRSKHARN